MDIVKHSKDFFNNANKHLRRNNLESILWMMNLIPMIAELSKATVPFWILHIGLLLYVYGLGCLVYQIKFAHGAGDFIKSYVNVSIFILTANSNYWFLMKWSLYKSVLRKVIQNDILSRQTGFLRNRHKRSLSLIKKMLLVFYISNMVNVCFIYLPNRVDVQNDNYSMAQCVGISPLSTSPKKEICQAVIFTLEVTLVTIVLNYQALLLFLIAHTTAMYKLMAEDITAFDNDEYRSNVVVKDKLQSLIQRHFLTLHTVDGLKLLYSMPIGINFGSNAVCMCLFFYLPFQDWIKFVPVLMYCFLVYFLYCFLCERLINASEEFERAVYCCGWENFGLKEMKMIYIIYMNAQKPVELLAANIIPVNIYTFATSLQAMFKFVTVVKF